MGGCRTAGGSYACAKVPRAERHGLRTDLSSEPPASRADVIQLDFSALSIREQLAIQVIHRAQGVITMPELGTRLGCDGQQAGALVDSLVAKGWVRASSVNDGPLTVRLHFAGKIAYENAGRR